jgi:two-component system phosphate regulon sensor histidine kinase PhoR
MRLWRFAVLRVALASLAGASGGLLVGHAAWGVALALGAYLFWQLVMLARLDSWLRLRTFSQALDAGGLWGDIVGQVARLHRRKRYHKRRLIQFFKQLRRSTEAIPDGIVMLAREREIVWFNSVAARLFHLRKVDLGLQIHHLVRP